MATKHPTVSVYVDRPGEFRWRRKAKNGATLSVSSESYTKRKACTEQAVAVNRPPFQLVEYDRGFNELRSRLVEE